MSDPTGAMTGHGGILDETAENPETVPHGSP